MTDKRSRNNVQRVAILDTEGRTEIGALFLEPNTSEPGMVDLEVRDQQSTEPESIYLTLDRVELAALRDACTKSLDLISE